MMTCPSCRGRGSTHNTVWHNDQECLRCRGTGKVAPPATAREFVEGRRPWSAPIAGPSVPVSGTLTITDGDGQVFTFDASDVTVSGLTPAPAPEDLRTAWQDAQATEPPAAPEVSEHAKRILTALGKASPDLREEVLVGLMGLQRSTTT